MSEVTTVEASVHPRPAAEPVRSTQGAGSGGERRLSGWVTGLAPLVLLGALTFVFLRWGPLGVFQQAFPPVEELTIERITFPRPGEVRIVVVNGGPEPVTVSQLLVDDAYWQHTIDGDRTIGRLERRTLTVPYPWVEGEPLQVRLITHTGVTFPAEVAVATEAPSVDARYVGTFALLGVYAGVIPVFLGLLWLPFLRGIERRWIDFFLSLTMGLLLFLGVDALGAALETAGTLAGALHGEGLVLLGVVGTPLVLSAIGRWRGSAAGERPATFVAALIALAIGLHNLGEGLAIGTAYATGEIALGTFLVVGFLLHNSTEGLGIVAPIAGERPGLLFLAGLGILAGAPTVLGTWIGGFTYSPVWVTIFYAVGVGAIAQVLYELWRLFARRGGAAAGLAQPLNALGFVVGMLIMYTTGLFVTA